MCIEDEFNPLPITERKLNNKLSNVLQTDTRLLS